MERATRTPIGASSSAWPRSGGNRWRKRLTFSLCALVACTGSIDGLSDPPVDEPPSVPDTLTPAPAAMRRLTESQYRNVVLDVLEVDASGLPLEPDTASNGFVAVGSTRNTISPLGVERHEDAAYDIAHRYVEARRLGGDLGCDPESEGCYADTIARLGLRLWRRPLEAAEVARYEAVAQQAQQVLAEAHGPGLTDEDRAPWEGLEFAIAGLLQSPHFLFRIELGRGGVVADEDVIGGHYYDDYEMASRVSFAICNTAPDETLLDAAAAGDLTTDAGLRREVERLVASPCARESIRGLFDELFELTDMANLSKDEAHYPQMSETLGANLRESLLQTVAQWVFEDGRSYPEFFTTPEAALNDELAGLYDVRGPEEGFAMVPLDPNRAGILTHAAFLARYSHTGATSPTLRGKFVRTSILCGSIPAPPDDVGELPEPSTEARTLRERLAAHRENPQCAGCHSLMDPIGLALENFDAVGAFRTMENGVEIDASGDLDGEVYDNAEGLGVAVARHPDLMSCMVRSMFRFTSGHIETYGEGRIIADLAERFEAEGSLQALLVELMMSRGFRMGGESQ